MAELLGDMGGKSLLEPSVGSGSLLAAIRGRPSSVDGVDIDPAVLLQAARNLPDMPIELHRTDFIDLFADGPLLSRRSPLRGTYDAVISNPPFGLYFSKDYRRRLKAAFPDLYVRESYGLFFIFSLLLLRSEGRYVFLLPDTFLTSRNHASLRRFICASGAPSHIVRFHSKRFETVNFGYGNLCIIAGNRSAVASDASVEWTDAFTVGKPLLDQPPQNKAVITGETLHATITTGWRNGRWGDEQGTTEWTHLGAVADCKTGIYTGDNEQFIGYDPARVARRLNGHPIKWNQQVCLRELDDQERKGGLSSASSYVPFIRGGHRDFAERTAWALLWSPEALAFYKTDKKARLQNADYYFRPGIAVPMVTSRRLSASLMDNAVFDQGVVGVFPASMESRDALLLYLNSSVASRLRNSVVGGGANNSANYLKRLPVPYFGKGDMAEARRIVSASLKSGQLARETCDVFMSRFLTKPNKASGP